MANSLEAETPSQSSAGKAKRPVADKGKGRGQWYKVRIITLVAIIIRLTDAGAHSRRKGQPLHGVKRWIAAEAGIRKMSF